MKHYDFIFAGGGVAGLTLAHTLIHSPLHNRSILIIDREVKDRNDVTLSFWANKATPFDHLVFRVWDRLQVVSNDGAITLDLHDYDYKTIRGIDFYQGVRHTLSGHPNVEFLLGEVDRIEDGADRARVEVEGQTYTGEWVFDSLFNIATYEPDKSRYCYLQQHFKGLEIETPYPAFDPQTAIMFDFRTPQENELRFFYLLPYSEHHALVEYVALSREKYEQDLRAHIETVLGIKDYETLNEEGGVSPLTDAPFPRRTGSRVMTIGIRGGMIKSSTGYALTRIIDDSAAIVASLLKVGHPFDVPADPFFFRLCDAGMLRVMARYGEWMQPLFLAMFRRNSIERIFRFLDQVSSPRENTALTASLVLPLLAQMSATLFAGQRRRSALGTMS